MVEQPYTSEEALQKLLADYPDLLAGDQSEGVPRRWILLGREIPVGDANTDSRWSIDHLFVDQDAIPTIVEVKRSEDTRIRREVVGQMLEYAANALAYWRIDELRSRFEAAAQRAGTEPDQRLAELLDDSEGPEQFWERVRTNLAASKVRLVFVADEIPAELRRLVEFLNEQMTSTEVLAVEVKQYVDSDGQHQTLVPRLLGQTERANRAKGRKPSRHWDQDSVLQVLEERQGAAAAATARRILNWSDQQGLQIFHGRGEQHGSLTSGTGEAGGCYPFTIYTHGSVEIKFQELSRRPPFDRRESLRELQSRLNAIDGVSIPDDGLDRRPTLRIDALQSDRALDAFLDAMRWIFEEVRRASSRPTDDEARLDAA